MSTETTPVDLEGLTGDEIRALLFELEVHKIELETQNQQLREAQRETLESNERFLRLYDSAPTGYLTLDSGGAITEANRSVSATLKVPRSRLIGRELSSFLAGHCQDRWHLALRDLIEGRARTDLTLEIVSAAGDTIDAQIVGTAADRNDGPREIHLSVIDVTELRRTEHALQAAVAAAAMAEERERRKLAADLHDDAGQLLSLASLKLHALRDAEETERDRRMVELEELLVEIRRRISSLSFQLSPPLLHDVGLVAALHWLADDLETSHGLVVKITEEQELQDLDENVRVTFYRAIRELLLNVVKHSGVKEARVRIAGDGRMARIAVEDAGVGMPPRAKRHGFGLLALRERVEQLGGSLEARGAASIGTTAVVSLPTHTDTQREET